LYITLCSHTLAEAPKVARIWWEEAGGEETRK